MSSHHNILGIPTNATKLQIKRAYYKKAKVLHPDVNKSPNAQKDFNRLNMAYEALTNPNYKIPKIAFKPRAQKTRDQLRREEIKRRQDAARKRAEHIAKKRRGKKSQLKPMELMKRDMNRILNFLIGLIILALIFFGIPILFFDLGIENSVQTFFNVMIGIAIFGIAVTSPAWVGIILFYLFPED